MHHKTPKQIRNLKSTKITKKTLKMKFWQNETVEQMYLYVKRGQQRIESDAEER